MSLSYRTQDLMEVPPEKVDQEVPEQLQNMEKGSVMLGSQSSGFIPPCKQAKMRRGRSTSMGMGSARSSTAGSHNSKSSRQGRNRPRSNSCGRQGCHNHDLHPHDARGRCLPVPEGGMSAYKAKRRLLGHKPPKCDNSGDGIFVSNRKKLERSKTR